MPEAKPQVSSPVMPERPRLSPPRREPQKRSWVSSLVKLVLKLAVWSGIAAGAYFGWPKVWPWIKPYFVTSVDPAAKPPARIVPVVTAAAQQRDLDLYLTGLGTVTAFNMVTVRSRVDGEMLKVAFTEGETVEQGDLLVEIDPRPYEVQLLQAQAQMAKDEAALKSAQLDLDRYNTLAKSKNVTQQQIDAQEAVVKQAALSIKADQAHIDNVKLQLIYCRITAPISGRIGLRMVDQGNMVHANDPRGLAMITQTQPIAVLFTVPQDDIVSVQRKINQGEKLVVDAYDRDFKTKLATGSLLAVDNQVDSSTGTLRLKAVFENQDNLLFPNQFVNARLLIETLHDAIVVPTAAVQRGPNWVFVYVVQPDETVELRKVVPGQTEGDVTVIESGLSAGEVVVTEGLDKLQPGTKVSTGASKKGDKKGAKEPEAAKSP